MIAHTKRSALDPRNGPTTKLLYMYFVKNICLYLKGLAIYLLCYLVQKGRGLSEGGLYVINEGRIFRNIFSNGNKYL